MIQKDYENKDVDELDYNQENIIYIITGIIALAMLSVGIVMIKRIVKK